MKNIEYEIKNIYLENYTVPDFEINHVELIFKLGENITRVHSILKITKSSGTSSLTLMGENIELIEIIIDKRILQNDKYKITDTDLTIFQVPDSFVLEIKTEIKPQENFSLEGLYKSSGNYCTQCEAEGFRKITYFLDRPDVMALFTTTIIADKEKYPVLLSNGNPVDSGDYEDGRHWAKWHDPFKKPCYLFALVAGDLAFIEDKFTTMNGRDVRCRIYVQHHNIDQCDHAMVSLKKSMKWDEETFGREYDLDVYNIVAVDDFNMGAMENKGLNVFNSKYVLAKQDTATDTDFIGIEAVIGHEYFHNWSGNRVTCRDWFQLTLKEGLTVFRDQQFTADMNSVAPKRIDDVKVLRTAQFAEDAGPMAHPIQPDAYQEINNFYTVTVYNKGAEVIRMIHTLLGEEKFRQGMDLYFERFDGQAVTTEEFVCAMEDASQIDLKQFRRWYKQAGTPEISVNESFDAEEKKYTLELSQTTPITPGQDEKKAFHIPVKISLMDEQAKLIALKMNVEQQAAKESTVLNFTESQQTFEFHDVKEKPVLSILQGYSAPVKLHFERDDEELAFCMAHEADDFNRWEAGQQLSSRLILSMITSIKKSEVLSLPDFYVEACKKILLNKTLDKALIARALTLPSLMYIGEMLPVIDVDEIHQAREFIYSQLAQKLKDDLLEVYQGNSQTKFSLSPEAMGQRFLKNQSLAYLMYLEWQGESLASAQFQEADNMTDQMAAFKLLLHHEAKNSTQTIDKFYQQWQHDNLVMDKWFTVQATVPHVSSIQNVKKLFDHSDFDIKNPNRVRALLGAFCAGNPRCFHEVGGFGYTLLGQYIETLDAMNPQIASRLCVPLTRWKRYNETRQKLMKAQLQRLISLPKLSNDVLELVEKSLKGC
ncbi:Membrane alanine aminopeptidase N [hydrothermal vent metagenome]|uniref:Membrane alanine aminopeptidase N n=1 Tax=hydrothermal vent metagenome TaxID=652676 RepID=A0A3B0W9D8_9ZZZZ